MATITGGTLQEQIQKAVSAHGVFKFKLAHMVEAQTNEIKPPTAAADNLCPVGQWLLEGLPERARLSERYRTVVDLHARFHHAAGEVAALSAARRHTEALEAMELTSSFKRTSDQLIAAMEAWADAAGEEPPDGSRAAQPSGSPQATGPSETVPTAASAAELEGRDEELPPGWWLDDPSTLASEAREAALQEPAPQEPAPQEPAPQEPAPQEDQVEPGQPAGAGERPEPADSGAVDGPADMSDWFGLPKSSDHDEPSDLEEPPDSADDGASR